MSLNIHTVDGVDHSNSPWLVSNALKLHDLQ